MSSVAWEPTVQQRYCLDFPRLKYWVAPSHLKLVTLEIRKNKQQQTHRKPNNNKPHKKSSSVKCSILCMDKLDKLQACVPRLLKDDKALPVVWLDFWMNCYVAGLQQKEITENSLSQSVFLAEVECLLISTRMHGAVLHATNMGIKGWKNEKRTEVYRS